MFQCLFNTQKFILFTRCSWKLIFKIESLVENTFIKKMCYSKIRVEESIYIYIYFIVYWQFMANHETMFFLYVYSVTNK